MSAYNVPEIAEKELAPIVESLGYEVVEIEYKKTGKDYTLTVFIYKKGGINLEDCEKVNNALDEPLERLDLSGGAPYTFNVSSPGLDRPIISSDDFRRNIGEEVEAFMKNIRPSTEKKKSSGKKTVGRLISDNGETFTLEVKGKPVIIEKSNIKLLRPYVKF